MGAAVDRSGSPRRVTRRGGFHEEGEIWGTLANGQDKVINARSRCLLRSESACGTASVATTNPAIPAESGILTTVSGTFHVHPKGEIKETTSSTTNSPGTDTDGGTTTQDF